MVNQIKSAGSLEWDLAGMPEAPSAPETLQQTGLTLGFLVWQVGFMSIGGEWFGMWQSQQWNGVPSAFRFLMATIAVLIFVAMPDQELDGRRSA